MQVQKSVRRHGKTLEHGSFEARETVHRCAARCPRGGALVTRRAAALAERIPAGHVIGYDVMVFVGLQRYVEHQQREEIRTALLERCGLAISSGELSALARRFVAYLERLHHVRADAIRAQLEASGGYPLHVDATGEDGRGTLLVAMAGWQPWILGAWKLPTERADAILPCLRSTVDRFGPPVAFVRDLGRAVTEAIDTLVAERGLTAPVLACHLHFLHDIGSDLLDAPHGELRALFRRFKVRPRLRDLARSLGRQIGREVSEARLEVTAWQEDHGAGHALPEGRAGLAVVRALTQWVLDYAADGDDLGLPFDRPYLDLHGRCLRAGRAIHAFLRTPPRDVQVLAAVDRLRRALDPVAGEAQFTELGRKTSRRADLFEELRAALRLKPKRARDEAQATSRPPPEYALRELQDVKTNVDALVDSLRERRPERGPAGDARDAIDLILRHIENHGKNLWGHVVPRPTGGEVRLVDRTNNRLEGFFCGFKRGERRRSGRKILTKDLEDLPPQAVLAANLRDEDYVRILCGSVEALPRAFARLDAEERALQLAGAARPAAPDPLASAPIPASASLPKEDRRIIRSDAMQSRILAAARSRAPKPGQRQGSPCLATAK